MRFIGLDIGSSSIKGAVLDLDNLTVGATTRVDCPDPIANLPPGHFELDPLAVLEAVQVVLRRLIKDVDDCAGIVSCSQMAGLVLADSHGNLLSNYMSWRDQRALEQHPSGAGSCYDVMQQRLGSRILAQLGFECKLGSSLSLLFWLAQHDRLPANVTPLLLGDFISMRLCETEPLTEFTNALGAMNLGTRSWHEEAFDRLALGDLHWPRLSESFEQVGRLAGDGGARIPCYPSVGDHQCALAGTLLEPGQLSINVSTGSQVSVLAAEFRAGDYQIRPYFDRQCLNTITHLPAGRSLNVLVDLLSEFARAEGISLTDPWPYIGQAAAAAGKTDLTADLAFFSGPMGHRGSIQNITVDNLNAGSLFRAAFHNMADNYEVCARRLAAGKPRPERKRWRELVLSGGLVQHCDVLREMVLERFDCPARICTGSEETLTGLLVLALVAAGRAGSVAEASEALRNRESCVSRAGSIRPGE